MEADLVLLDALALGARLKTAVLSEAGAYTACPGGIMAAAAVDLSPGNTPYRRCARTQLLVEDD